MNPTNTPNWHTANYIYLMTEIATIHQTLKDRIALKNNQPTQPQPDREIARQTAAANLPAPSRLEQLCTTYGLSTFERDILLLCVAMELDPSLPSLLAEAHGNQQMVYPTLSIALAALNSPHLNATKPTAPLRRWQLIDVGQGMALTQSPIKIDESILYYLAGEDYQDNRISNLIKPQPPEILEIPLSIPQLEIVQEITENWLKKKTTELENTQNPNYPILQLCGKDTDSKEVIISTICTTLKLKPQLLRLNYLPSDSDTLNLLITRWQRQAILTNHILLIEADKLDRNDTITLNSITEIVENSHTPLIITTREQINFPKRRSLIYDVPEITGLKQLEIWQESLPKIAPELVEYAEKLVSYFNLSGKTIINACAQVNRNIETSSNNQITNIPSITEQLWHICRTTSRPQLDEFADRIDTSATWKNLILPTAEKNSLRSIVTHVQQRNLVCNQWEFGSLSRRGNGIMALFAGTSGTGKTTAAEVIGNELKLDVYRIELSAVLSKYIGESEKNLQRIFEAAAGANVILLFDEADALFGKRTEVKDSHDRYANMTISQLLQQIEKYRGLAILTTNMKDALDRAFTRRLHFTIEFPFPDKEARIRIWKSMIPAKAPTKDLNFTRLGQLIVSGGSIRNIVLNAAFMAADNGESIMMKHILAATRSECVKNEKLLTDVEIKGWV